MTHWPHSDGSMNHPPGEMNGHEFQMGLWLGKQEAQNELQLILLQRIVQGVEQMPERLARKLGTRPTQSRFAAMKDLGHTLRIVVPALLITGMVALRLYDSQAFTDVLVGAKALVTWH